MKRTFCRVEEAEVEVAVIQPTFNKGKVEEAVQVLAWPRFKEATTAPVVGEMVRVLSLLENEENAHPTQVPLTEKHPVVTLMPLAKVEVPVPKILSSP